MASSDRTTSQQFQCPSCRAEIGEPCRLSPQFSQEYSHVSRHQLAERASWAALTREMPVSTGWTVGSR
jgi:hypothetical protein